MRIEALPAEARDWDRERLATARTERETRAKELVEIGADEMSAADVAELRAINDDVAWMSVLRPHPGHAKPRRPGSGSWRSGFRPSVGEAFVKGVTGGKPMAAIDGTSGGTMVPSFFDPDLREMPSRRLFLRDLLPTVRVSGDKVDYVRQTVQTHAAAAVASAAEKPTSTYTVERVTATVTTIAHVSQQIDRNLLADFRALEGFLNDQLVIGVLLEEEDQVLNGSGDSPELEGILNTSGLQTQAKGSDPVPDAVYKAMTKVRAQFFEPDAVVFHPNDWQAVRLLAKADGEYLWGHPSEAGPELLWDKRVVVSPLIAEGTALVGSFAAAACVYDREQARVTFTESGLADSAGQELWTRNLVRFRGESRIGLGVAFPAAFCQVTGV